jgi:hypothetical protein
VWAIYEENSRAAIERGGWEVMNEGEIVLTKKQKWLAVLSDSQRELREQGNYDQINLTEKQKANLGKEGCCWIESPTLYGYSVWCQ